MENNFHDKKEKEYHKAQEIKCIEDLTSYLINLKDKASKTGSALIDAQLEVINYAESHKILTKPFDTFFENLKRAIDTKYSEQEELKVDELSQMLIHNFIIFTNAKLEFAISKNKFLGRDLLINANRELVNSCISIIKFTEWEDQFNNTNSSFRQNSVEPKLTFNNTTYFIDQIETNFTKNITVKDGEWEKSANYELENVSRRQELENLIVKIKTILSKLDEHHTIIGKSYLVSIAIDSYAEKMVSLQKEVLKEVVKNRLKTYKPIFICAVTLFATYILFGKLIYDSFLSQYSFFKDLRLTFNINILLYNWILFSMVMGIFYLYIIFPKFKVNKMTKDYKDLSQKYMEA